MVDRGGTENFKDVYEVLGLVYREVTLSQGGPKGTANIRGVHMVNGI